MNNKEATGKIAEFLKEAREALTKAQNISDETGVPFYWDGPAYGMGGHYTPKVQFNNSGCSEDFDNSGCSEYEETGSWSSSSHSC